MTAADYASLKNIHGDARQADKLLTDSMDATLSAEREKTYGAMQTTCNKTGLRVYAAPGLLS